MDWNVSRTASTIFGNVCFILWHFAIMVYHTDKDCSHSLLIRCLYACANSFIKILMTIKDCVDRASRTWKQSGSKCIKNTLWCPPLRPPSTYCLYLLISNEQHFRFSITQEFYKTWTTQMQNKHSHHYILSFSVYRDWRICQNSLVWLILCAIKTVTTWEWQLMLLWFV